MYIPHLTNRSTTSTNTENVYRKAIKLRHTTETIENVGKKHTLVRGNIHTAVDDGNTKFDVCAYLSVCLSVCFTPSVAVHSLPAVS